MEYNETETVELDAFIVFFFLPDRSRLGVVVIVVVVRLPVVVRSLAVRSLVAGGRLFVAGVRLLVRFSVTRSRNMRTVSLASLAR